MFFLHFMLFPTFLEKNNSGNKKIKLFLEQLFFKFTVFFMFFFMLDLFPIFKKNVYFFGNIEKCPFTYWLNGRWFLQIVDIGNINMKLSGRWLPHIVDWESISNIIIYKKNCGVSF